MHKFVLALMSLLFFTNCIFVKNVRAQDTINSFNEWSGISVLHDGRVKPIDSFSAIILEQISGARSANEIDHNQWLAHTLFLPEEAIFNPIFKIKDAQNFGLDKKQRYDFTVVSKIINDNKETIDKLRLIPFKDLSIEQANLLSLHDNYGVYNQLLRSMTALIPLNIQGEEDKKSYFEYYKDDAADKYTELKIIRAAGGNNIYFKVIPTQNLKQPYSTIWQVLLGEVKDKNAEAMIENWHSMALAYRAGDDDKWQDAIKDIHNNQSDFTVLLEKKYNDFNLTFWSFIFFISCFIFLMLSGVVRRLNFEKISTLFLGLGSVAITIDIVMRIIISNRPPVGTLYESILFVCMITAIGSLIFALKKIDKTALFIGSISGIILLPTATSFVGVDSFSPLVAVLNTDFWLATHVIIVTAGYAFCILTALYAHIIMWRQDYNKKLAPYKNLNVLAILSLLFVTVGTVLGGLWADQSWGRFWGWDPKENGAMLIILWIIWLLHGKITHDLPIKFYMAGIAFLSVIVALAWFGVNLLSVGLHSYGFVSGIALGLGLFCSAEVLIISYLLFFHRRAKV